MTHRHSMLLLLRRLSDHYSHHSDISMTIKANRFSAASCLIFICRRIGDSICLPANGLMSQLQICCPCFSATQLCSWKCVILGVLVVIWCNFPFLKPLCSRHRASHVLDPSIFCPRFGAQLYDHRYSSVSSRIQRDHRLSCYNDRTWSALRKRFCGMDSPIHVRHDEQINYFVSTVRILPRFMPSRVHERMRNFTFRTIYLLTTKPARQLSIKRFLYSGPLLVLRVWIVIFIAVSKTATQYLRRLCLSTRKNVSIYYLLYLIIFFWTTFYPVCLTIFLLYANIVFLLCHKYPSTMMLLLTTHHDAHQPYVQLTKRQDCTFI